MYELFGTDKNHEKNMGIFPKFSQGENVFVKMGELFAHFDKHILILRTFEEKVLPFSPIFVIVIASY